MLRSARLTLGISVPLVLFAACSNDAPSIADALDASSDAPGSADASSDLPASGDAIADAAGDAAAEADVVITPPCADLTKNGDESDVDCGGSTCAPCGHDKACGQNADCAGVCTAGRCESYSPPVQITDPAGGATPEGEGLRPMLEDGEGTPLALYTQLDVTETSNQLHARAFVNGAWGAPTRLDPAGESASHQYRFTSAVVGPDLFVMFNSGECCDSRNLYVTRRHTGAFEAPALVVSNTSDSYLVKNGDEVTALSEATFAGTRHIAGSHWNGTAFSTGTFAATSGDEGNIDPSQNLVSTGRWNGWVTFKGNLTPGARRGLLASRRVAGVWSTPQFIDVTTGDETDSSPIAIHLGTGSENTVAFVQKESGVSRLLGNHVADGAANWDGAVPLSPDGVAISTYSLRFVSLGAPNDLLLLAANPTFSVWYAAHRTANTWLAMTAIPVPAGATNVRVEGAIQQDGVNGALVCVLGDVGGNREAWLMTFQNNTWTTPVPVLPLGTGRAQACALFADGNRIVARYQIGGKSALRAARWTSNGLSPVTPVGNDEATSGHILLPATARHPRRLAYRSGAAGDEKLYVADWPDSGIETPHRLDVNPTGGVDGFSAVALASGKEGFLYREAGGLKAIYAVIGH